MQSVSLVENHINETLYCNTHIHIANGLYKLYFTFFYTRNKSVQTE